MEILLQGLPVIAVLIGLLAVVHGAVRRFHFDSEDVLEIRTPDGRIGVLRLSSLNAAPPAQKAEEVRKAMAELA